MMKRWTVACLLFLLASFLTPPTVSHAAAQPAGLPRSDAAAAAIFPVRVPRVALLSTAGTLYVKEGPLDARWFIQAHDVAAYDLEGTRIGILNKDGDVYVKEGALNSRFVWESSGVQSFQLEGNR